MTAPSPAGCRIGIVVENKHDFQLELRRDEFGSPVLVEFGATRKDATSRAGVLAAMEAANQGQAS
jgi:hypothetical protein